ncbi:autoinducer 2 sensor kinase/phosphatase LuxQ [bacterium BMS3Abin04]|nr:autoinducer 2 sensor kinase/phosphatase LuxQ [bacterium BMS3Abin04]
MKINVKLLLIIFAAIVLISVSSTLIYYSSTKKLLQNQDSKELVNSANNFIFVLQKSIQNSEDEFIRLKQTIPDLSNAHLNSTDLDFILSTNNRGEINFAKSAFNNASGINKKAVSISQFVELNPNIILRKRPDGNNFYYFGRVITSKYLTELAERIRADIALIKNSAPIEFSNQRENKEYLISMINAAKKLKNAGNFEISREELENADFLATHYIPTNLISNYQNLDFLIFIKSKEAAEFRSTMSMFVVVILLAGIPLSIILLFLFTTKIRRQISYLDLAVSKISSGDLNHKVKIITNDEIGRLGEAFNKMVDKLKEKEKIEKEYSEFLTLINKNPTLDEVSVAALNKIISTTKVPFGALYLVEGEGFRLLTSYGFGEKQFSNPNNVELYRNAIKDKKKIEFNFNKDFPVINTGITEIRIKYILILPIIYNREVIAILELASGNNPPNDINLFLDTIQEQLSIGLINAKTFEQQKELVEELKKLNEAYQKKNRQVTEQNEELVKLHNELKRNTKELELQTSKALESAKVKSQFLASMSHELRTPQNSIIGLTELILRDTVTLPETKERLKVVLRNSKRLLDLINNILEFSKIESGNVGIKNENFLLQQFLNDITSVVEPLVVEKNLSFNINIKDECNCLLYTDRIKLEQIFYNLISNAIKFTQKGFIKIDLLVEKDSDDLTFEISDSGIGIDEDNREKVFEEFRQVDEGISRSYNGTGLGLAICKKYIEMLGGQISLESKPGIGTKFSVTIPNVVKEKFDPSKTGYKISHNINAASVKPIAYLILEGKETRKIISDYLVSNNFDVLINSDDINLNEISKLKPNAVIIDANYPGCWNILHDFKMVSTNNEIPIVIINIIEKKNIGFGFGVSNYFVKPTLLNNIVGSFEKVYSPSGLNESGKLFFVGDKSLESLQDKNNLPNNLEMIFLDDYTNILGQIISRNPDLIILDLVNDNYDPFDLVYKIQNNRYTSSIPVVVIINKNIDNEISRNLTNKLDRLTYKVKLHPLDVLKVIRDRLHIYENEELKNILIIDDSRNNPTDKNITNTKIDRGTKASGKILVVDDDNDALYTVGEIVKNLGFTVIYAKNGFECLDILEKEAPGLILLDIMMPKLDGFETIKRIREDERYTNLPIYALTAYAMLSDREILERNGFDDLITKPINTNLLKNKLQNLFGKIKIHE